MEEYRQFIKDYFPELFEALTEQTDSDFERWGDTWKFRPIGDWEGEGDQVERIMQRIRDYYNQYQNAGIPFPFKKVIMECVIGWIREETAKGNLKGLK